MKSLSLLLCATLLAVAAPAPSARADVAVSVDFFYDALSPQGDWIYTDNYGYIWQPTIAQQPDWAPYADGYWAYTDAGWTWISNEDFGWATYHYGRWVRMYDRWFWVPGNEWAPAWVSWRQADDYVGWAPLPPEASWSNDVGFNWWTDSYYDIGPSYYSFVPLISFITQNSLRPFIIDRRRNWDYVDRSRNITNISYRQNVFNHIFVGGPDPVRIDRFGNGNNRIRRLSLHRDDDDFRRNWLDNRGDRPRNFSSLSRIDRDRLVVAAPSIRRDNVPGLPPRVRERFDRPEIDRGWRGAGDPAAAERLRNRQREDMTRARGERMPEKKPVFITSKAPPPAVGRVLKPEERRTPTPRPDPRRVDEEVRKATPNQPPTPPRVVNEPPRPGTPGSRPGMPGNDGPGRGPQVRPGESPAGRLPGESGDGRRGGAPVVPGQPTIRPGIPGTTPPGNRPDRIPETRRPTPPNVSPEQPRTRPVPMPEVRPENRVRPNPMPRPEAPRANPTPPMPRPTPQVRPSMPERRPEIPRPEPRQIPQRPQPRQPEARPMPRPTPQVRPSMPERRPEIPRQPEARPMPQPRGPSPEARPPGGPGQRGGGGGGERGPGRNRN